MAIKIHPIQERLRQGKNKPQPKFTNLGPRGTNAQDGYHPDKGKYLGRCNITACQEPGAIFFNNGTNAYYCSECAADIHAGTRYHLDWLTERMIVLRDDHPEKELSTETIETEQDIWICVGRRVEKRMQADWDRWQETRARSQV